MNACAPDPCAPETRVTALQLAIGDDWGWSFAYLDANKQQIMLGQDKIQGQLYAAYQTTPLLLDETSGRSLVVDDATASFLLGLEKAITETLQADPPSQSSSHLQIQRVSQGGLIRTIGHIPLRIMTGSSTPQPNLQPIGYIDPLTSEMVIVTGYTTQVPGA